MPTHLRVTWRDQGRAPLFPPDPAYPTGTALDLSLGAAEACQTPLPYPATGIGAHVVHCVVCGVRVACGAAGRPDDPNSVRVACRRSTPPAAA